MILITPRAFGLSPLVQELVAYLAAPRFWEEFPEVQQPEHRAAACCMHVLLLKHRLPGRWPPLYRVL